MKDTDRIREQIRRMRRKGVEPEVVYMEYALWKEIGCPRSFSGVYCVEADGLSGRFEVR